MNKPIPAGSRKIPASLLPKKPEPPNEQEVFITIVVSHPKLYDHIKDRVFVIGNIDGKAIKGFVILEDPKHPLHKGDMAFRQALVQTGLATPEQAGMNFPLQLQAGLPDRTEEP